MCGKCRKHTGEETLGMCDDCLLAVLQEMYKDTHPEVENDDNINN